MSICPRVWLSRDKRKISISERNFDGIETNYTTILMLTPDEARYIATDLWALAEKIDGKTEKESKMKAIRENTDAIVAAAKIEAMS